MKLIFLDIDGVLNHETGYRTKQCTEHYELNGHHYQPFALESKRLLNQLIDQTEAKIVISSTWRLDGLEQMKAIWEHEGMHGEVIDVTPDYHIDLGIYATPAPRGSEIEIWLKRKGISRSEFNRYMNRGQLELVKDKALIYDNYIIIDDDSDMLYNQRNHFVHVRSHNNPDGFNEKYYLEALDKLSKTAVELNSEQ